MFQTFVEDKTVRIRDQSIKKILQNRPNQNTSIPIVILTVMVVNNCFQHEMELLYSGQNC